MPLTCHDVRTKQFNPSGLVRKGYDEGEVDDFLDEVVAALEERDSTIAIMSERAAAAGQASTRPGIGTSRAGHTEPAPSGPEAATALLAMAERTAEEHVTAGRAAAAEARANAEQEAIKTAKAAQAEARQLLSEAEVQRRQLLASLHDEQHQLEADITALRATAERTRDHLQGYLTDALSTVQQLALPEQPRELKVLSA